MDDRDLDYTLMNVQRYGGGVSSILMTSTAMSMKLMVFLLRMAKKGLMSLKYSNDYTKFLEKTGGNFAVYNIPLSKAHTEHFKENMEKIASLESSLAETKSPRKKAELRQQIKAVKADMPELLQLEKLGVDFFALPKVNGLENTLQVAVASKDQMLFKNWFLNHVSGELSGGAKDLQEIKAMTEGNSSIYNIPVEGERVQDMLHDLDILAVNYAVLPDLKVGDGCTQIAVANTDVPALKSWFAMFQQQQLLSGEEVPEMYQISEGAYVDTGVMDTQEYIDHSDPVYQQANAEYESQSQTVTQKAALQNESSEAYLKLCQDENYTKITIDRETLTVQANQAALNQIGQMGYFGCRVPGTYKNFEADLMLPKDKVFIFRDGETYAGFIPKGSPTKVFNSTSGRVEEWNHDKVMVHYDKITRSLKNVKDLVQTPRKTPGLEQSPLPGPGQPDTENIPLSAWVVRERQPEGRNRFGNFSQREYDSAALSQAMINKLNQGGGKGQPQLPKPTKLPAKTVPKL